MGKILYVEDDLNVNDLLRLFGKYFSPEEKKQLKALPLKTNSLIQQQLQGNPFLEAEYDFIRAIQKIDADFEHYSFFIIDRNLFDKNPYSPENVPKPVDLDIRKEEEGDYLFFLLFDKYFKYANPRSLLENFYFLTAHPKENIKIHESLHKLSMFFQPDHIIEKANTGQVASFIENKINRFEELVMKSDHRAVFEIFEKGFLDRSFADDLLSVLKVVNSSDTSEIKKNVNLLREIFQEVLRKIIEVKPIKKTMPPEFYQSGNLDIPKILDFLNGTPTYASGWNPTTTEYFSNTHKMLSDFGFWKVCSEIAHGGKSGRRAIRYLPTRYSLPILVNILMDFLIWFGDFMEKHK